MLENVDEGNSDTHQLGIFTSLAPDAILAVLDALERRGLVTLVKKYDEHYKAAYWQAETTEKGKGVLRAQ